MELRLRAWMCLPGKGYSMRSIFQHSLLVVAVVLATASPALAQLVVPAYNSRPGAAYTLYLNFTGFSFTGTWGGTGLSPGNTPAYDTDGNTANFSATELTNIQRVWAATAEKYAPFNVNVTTVDPAPVAFTAPQKQAFYDQTPRLMHTVIGGNGSWIGGGGYSYQDVAQYSYGTSGNGGAGQGWKTNWAYSALAPSNLKFVAEVTSHENGHGMGLSHQSDITPAGGFITTYSGGNWTTTGALGGNGTVAPVMGNSYYAQRGTFRNGTYEGGTGGAFQNDPAVIQSNNGIGNFTDDSIGRSVLTATTMPMIGNTINFNLAKGTIVPVNNTNPNPIGASNYHSGYYSFSTTGGLVTVNLVSGSSFITPGVADPGSATLDGSLFILDSLGSILFSANSITLGETISQNLAPGNYFIQVSSAGGKTLGSLNNPTAAQSQYYDMGSYFLTGFIPTAVPEPTTIAMCGLFVLGWGYRTWSIRRLKKKTMDAEMRLDSGV